MEYINTQQSASIEQDVLQKTTKVFKQILLKEKTYGKTNRCPDKQAGRTTISNGKK